jgi:hypothetical protein
MWLVHNDGGIVNVLALDQQPSLQAYFLGFWAELHGLQVPLYLLSASERDDRLLVGSAAVQPGLQGAVQAVSAGYAVHNKDCPR